MKDTTREMFMFYGKRVKLNCARMLVGMLVILYSGFVGALIAAAAYLFISLSNVRGYHAVASFFGGLGVVWLALQLIMMLGAYVHKIARKARKNVRRKEAN